MTAHDDTARFLATVAALPAVTPGDAHAVRARRSHLAALYDSGPTNVRVRTSMVGSVLTREYLPPVIAGEGTIVYVHGGGWVAGDLDTHDGTCRRLGTAAGRRLISVGYRQPPEHPSPAAVDDVVAVITRQEGDLLLAGDSSGAHIAFETAERVENPRLVGLVLIQPAVNSALASESWSRLGTGYFLTASAMRWYWDTYLAGATSTPLSERALDSLPPALLVTSALDPSVDEAVALGVALKRAGVALDVHELGDVPHGCLTLPGAFPSQLGEFDRMGAWIDARFRP